MPSQATQGQPLVRQFENASNYDSNSWQNVNHYWESNGNWIFAPYFMLSWWMLKCCVKSTIKCSALTDNVPIDWSTKTGLTTPGAAQPFIEFQQNSWRKFHLPAKTCCLFLNWFRTDIWEVESEQEVSGGTFAYKASNYRQFEEPLNLAILKILCFIL